MNTVKRSDIDMHLEPDMEADVSWAHQPGFEEDLEAIERGEMMAYGVVALVAMPSTLGNGHTVMELRQSPGVWGVWLTDPSEHNPYVQDLFAEERALLETSLMDEGVAIEP